jgi:hypothetical protein
VGAAGRAYSLVGRLESFRAVFCGTPELPGERRAGSLAGRA